MKRIYIAGPEVFLPEPDAAARHLKEALASHGLEGVFPMDAAIDGAILSPRELSAAIFEANVALINTSDGVLASMIPFRGPSMDVGTGWEMGYAFGRGLPVVGYMSDPFAIPAVRDKAVWSSPAVDFRTGKWLSYLEKANAWNYTEAKVHDRAYPDRDAFPDIQTLQRRNNRLFDRNGWSVEDFGLSCPVCGDKEYLVTGGDKTRVTKLQDDVADLEGRVAEAERKAREKAGGAWLIAVAATGE